jgi:hypothetical protein
MARMNFSTLLAFDVTISWVFARNVHSWHVENSYLGLDVRAS